MRRYLMSLMVAAALVAGLTACRTYEHPNGCVEILDVDAPGNPPILFLEPVFSRPAVHQWENLQGTSVLGYTQQSDTYGVQATIWTTIACAQGMDPYPPPPNP